MDQKSSQPGDLRLIENMSAELAMMGSRITAMGVELNAYRQRAAVPPQPAPLPVPAPEPEPVSEAVPELVPAAWSELPEPADPPRARSRSLNSTTVLAWTGGVVTLLGVVLALVLAIQRGYLGPLPRVVAGFGLATVLVLIAGRLYAKPNGRTGGLTLAATGVATLYLDIVAATALYGYLPAYLGLLAGFVAALAGLLLAARWDSPGFACFVVACCAVAVPILTGASLVLPGFLLALKAATVPVALRKRWNVLSWCAAVPPLLAILAVEIGQAQHGRAGVGTAVVALLVTIVFCAVAVILLRRDPADDGARGMLTIAALPTLLAVPLLPTTVGGALAAVVAAGMAGLWLFGRRGLLPDVGVVISGLVASIAACHATLTLLGPAHAAVPLFAEALVLTAIALRLRSTGVWANAVGYAVLGWLIALITAAPPPAVLAPGARDALVMAGTAGLGTLVAVLVPLVGHRLGVLAEPEENPGPWLPAVPALLWGSAATVVGLATAVLPGERGFVAGHVLVTVGWVVVGLVLLLRRGDQTVWRVTGLTLAGASVLKLLLFDLSTLDGLPRVAAALGAGLVLLLAGARYARRSAESVPG